MQPLVSICIPTYNRADYLKETIESIICQPEFLSGEVEIVVSDNASTDKTEEICAVYNKYQNFFYFKNSENVLDQNYPLAISRAHGKLRKLNNDTFLLNKDALSKMCKIVQEYDTDRPYVYFGNSGKNMRTVNFHDFVLMASYIVTWLPTFSIWDNECEDINMDTDACQLRLWQVKKAYEIAYKKNSILMFEDTLGRSVTPSNKDISYGLYKVFYCNFLELLQPYVQNGAISVGDKEYIEKKLLFDFFRGWIVRYELNNGNMKYSKEENLKDVVFEHYKNRPYWKQFKRKYKATYIKYFIFFKIKQLLKR